MLNLKVLQYKLQSLVLFRDILEDDVFKKFTILLDSMNQKNAPMASLNAYADFAHALVPYEFDFGKYVLDYILDDVNPYLIRASRQEEAHYMVEECLKNDLGILQEVASVTSGQVKQFLDIPVFLPDWRGIDPQNDLLVLYQREYSHITTSGYGVFRKGSMFVVRGDEFVPVTHPDPIRLSQLVGYKKEQALVLSNTRALIEGKPAANVLLYGDSGTGKSSTIKAVVNELRGRGVRLIEIRKDQLSQLQDITLELSKLSLKFILFIDDLSFSRPGDDFTQLKAVLEGSVLSRSPNIAIYATSNRRHLVKETFSDREAQDDLHLNESIHQVTSLSERFGLAIPYTTPTKEQYLDIVAELALLHNLKPKKGELEEHAEAFALQKGGRSGRVARQFVDQLVSLGK